MAKRKKRTVAQVSLEYASKLCDGASPCVQNSQGYVRRAFMAGVYWQRAQSRRRAVNGSENSRG